MNPRISIGRVLEHYSKPADLPVAVTKSERELIFKALGLDKGFKVTRNRYFTTAGSCAHRAFEAMAKRGLVLIGAEDSYAGRVVVQVTQLGFAVAKQPTRRRSMVAPDSTPEPKEA